MYDAVGTGMHGTGKIPLTEGHRKEGKGENSVADRISLRRCFRILHRVSKSLLQLLSAGQDLDRDRAVPSQHRLNHIGVSKKHNMENGIFTDNNLCCCHSVT